MRKIYSKDQIMLKFETETLTTDAPKPLEPIALPNTDIKLLEQLALALQTRDKDLLDLIVGDAWNFLSQSNKLKFVIAYLKCCNQLEAKHGNIYIQTVNGSCQRKACNFGQQGLAVTVFSVSKNNLLWSFNLITTELANGKLDLWKCPNFGVNVEDV